MKNKNILVVRRNFWKEVSLESGRACANALKKKGYKVQLLTQKNLNLINKNKTDIILMLYTEKTVKMELLKVILNI